MDAPSDPPADSSVDTRLLRAESLLQEEFVQAWEHYRHNEQLRGQYVNYAFTLTLATLAVAIPFAPSASRDAATFILAEGFLLVYALLMAFSFIGTIKIDATMRHYASVWAMIRDHRYKSLDLSINIARLDVYTAGNRIARNPWLRLQSWAELLLATLLVGGSATACALDIAFIAVGDANWWQHSIMATLAAATVGMTTSCLLVLIKRNGSTRSAPPDQNRENGGEQER